MNEQLELSFLKQDVEQAFGRRLATTADFEALAEEMNDSCSASTLKRLWGYVAMRVDPRPSTLNALARYVGFRDYTAFCKHLADGRMRSSGYFRTDHVTAESLQAGDRIRIGWRPDRIVLLEYLGEARFRVVESEGAQLQEGDEFTTESILKGFPLVLSGIDRGGVRTDPYIGGRDGGIVFIRQEQ